jgi:thymidylate synthase
MPKLTAIVCRQLSTNIIGINNTIPWKCSVDLLYFKKITNAVLNQFKKNLLIVGYNTFISLPEKFILDNRRFAVCINPKKQLCDDYILQKNRFLAQDPEGVIEYSISPEISVFDEYENVYIIGGCYVYEIYQDIISEVLLGEINDGIMYNGETVSTYDLPAGFVAEEKIITTEKYTMTRYIRKSNHPEMQYINLMKDIMRNGNLRDMERTGTGTLSLFGRTLTVDLSRGYCPMLASRKMTSKLITDEYRWYLSGSTNVDDLRKISGKQKTVWDGNTSRAFLDSNGLKDLAEGDIGASYGFQFRHFGANYIDCKTKYVGVDQVESVIEEIHKNPHGRRHIISLWNPKDISRMALPPCLRDYQFYVRKQLNSYGEIINVIDCKADQRSSDFFLAGYWNIHQVAYLIYFVIDELRAKYNDVYCPGKIIMNYGDVHIYNHQYEQCKSQIQICMDNELVYYSVASFSQEKGFTIKPEYKPLSNLTSKMAI